MTMNEYQTRNESTLTMREYKALNHAMSTCFAVYADSTNYSAQVTTYEDGIIYVTIVCGEDMINYTYYNPEETL